MERSYLLTVAALETRKGRTDEQKTSEVSLASPSRYCPGVE